MYKVLRDHFGPTAVVDRFPMIAKLNADFEAWRHFVADYGTKTGVWNASGASASAKRAISKIIYTGKPPFDLPFLWALVEEVRDATHSILALPQFAYLRQHFGDRRKPEASRLAYALMAKEDEALQTLASTISSVAGAQVYTYLYDGLIFRVPEQGREELMKKMQEFESTTSLKVIRLGINGAIPGVDRVGPGMGRAVVPVGIDRAGPGMNRAGPGIDYIYIYISYISASPRLPGSDVQIDGSSM